MAKLLPFFPTETVSSSVSINNQFPLITPGPIALVVQRQNGESSRNTFTYPGCKDDPNGPCQLQQSSSEACRKEFATLTRAGFASLYCLCTNDYYVRSSECWIGCYQARSTSLDTDSISRISRMKELDCESLSLAVESQSAFYSSLGLLSESMRNASTTAGSGIGANTTTRDLDPPATGSVTPLETSMNWVDRPTATGRTQGGGAVSIGRGAGYDVICLVTVVLALLTFFQLA